jgi:hypothetical protein
MKQHTLSRHSVPFTVRPKTFREFLRACAFRSAHPRDDLAAELLQDAIAAEHIDSTPLDEDWFATRLDEHDLGEEWRSLMREFRKLAKSAA